MKFYVSEALAAGGYGSRFYLKNKDLERFDPHLNPTIFLNFVCMWGRSDKYDMEKGLWKSWEVEPSFVVTIIELLQRRGFMCVADWKEFDKED